MKKIILAWTILLAGTSMCWAQGHGAAPGDTAQHAADPSPHPAVPEHPVWVRPVVMVTAAMFVLALLVGLFVRATMPEEMPQTHAHDEHHGHKDPHGDMGLGGHDNHGHQAHH
jgi:hypothetical protein